MNKNFQMLCALFFVSMSSNCWASDQSGTSDMIVQSARAYVGFQTTSPQDQEAARRRMQLLGADADLTTILIQSSAGHTYFIPVNPQGLAMMIIRLDAQGLSSVTFQDTSSNR